MQILKKIFAPLLFLLEFINKYFKSMLFLLIVYFLFFSSSSDSLQAPNLAEIELKGQIIDQKELLLKIQTISENPNIKGVLFNIDSPGGALSPSMEISLAIKELKTKKPVVVYASGTMASGSYLSGVWANKIYANPGSFIGSIGVIMQGANLSELAHKIGISEQTISAGEFKQAGTFTREWTPKEKASLQELVNKSYDLFLNEVASARNLDLNSSASWANARVFLAKDAKQIGLIDEVSSYSKAKDELTNISGVTTPIWEKESEFKKALNSLSLQSANLILDVLFPAALSAR